MIDIEAIRARLHDAYCGSGDYEAALSDACNDVAALVAEVERLRADSTRLAECMECHPDEVSRLIQQHAPWNGKAGCDDALHERAAVVAWLREVTFHTLANAIERGVHRRKGE